MQCNHLHFEKQQQRLMDDEHHQREQEQQLSPRTKKRTDAIYLPIIYCQRSTL
jgi:hypothetical protein